MRPGLAFRQAETGDPALLVRGHVHYDLVKVHMVARQMEAERELERRLRGNGGGLLSQAVNIADEFLDEDKLIVYTEGSHVPRNEYRCKRQGLFEKGALVLLVDEGSASASEV